MIGCFNCPITSNCPITLFDYNCAECLVKNEAANTLITFEEFVMIVINNLTAESKWRRENTIQCLQGQRVLTKKRGS